MKFNGTITLSCTVQSLDKAVSWYQDVLGFTLVFRVDEAGWAEVASPARGVSIGLQQGEPAHGGGGTTPVFGVEDIDAARAELEQKNVRFEGDTIELPGMVKLATFFDPDGNSYMLAQSLAA